MLRAAAHTGPAIFASGGIVVAAMLVLSLADFNATREMGPLLALGIVVMMACGLTLLPALLAVFGRRAFWPAIPREEAEPRRGRARAGAASASSSGAGRRCSSRVSVGRARARRARQPRTAAATSTCPSSTATRPSPSQGQELIRERFDPAGPRRAGRGRDRRRRRARGQGRAREGARRGAVEHRLRSRRTAGSSRSEVLLEHRPVLDAGDGPDPAPARGRATRPADGARRWSAASRPRTTTTSRRSAPTRG